MSTARSHFYLETFLLATSFNQALTIFDALIICKQSNYLIILLHL
jgi:hypothetical protein